MAPLKFVRRRYRYYIGDLVYQQTGYRHFMSRNLIYQRLFGLTIQVDQQPSLHQGPNAPPPLHSSVKLPLNFI